MFDLLSCPKGLEIRCTSGVREQNGVSTPRQTGGKTSHHDSIPFYHVKTYELDYMLTQDSTSIVANGVCNCVMVAFKSYSRDLSKLEGKR